MRIMLDTNTIVSAVLFPDSITAQSLVFAVKEHQLLICNYVDAPDMRDDDDKPILQAAINANADAILTGDKDFHALKIEQPVIMSPNAMLELE